MGRCFYSDVAPALRTRSVNDNNDFIMEEVQVINPLKGQSDNGWHFEQQVYDAEGITRAVKAGGGSGNIPKVIAEPQILRKFRTEEQKERRRRLKDKGIKFCEASKAPAKDGCCNTLTSVQKDNLLCEPTYRIRKLTPRECFRLMGVDDPNIDKLMGASISNSQLYKCAGNSIVVDVLYHIFRKIYVEPNPDNGVQTLF